MFDRPVFGHGAARIRGARRPNPPAAPLPALRRLQKQLRQARVEAEDLRIQRDQVQGHERERIARDLHDGLQQTLAAARMALAEATRRLAGEAGVVGAIEFLADVDEHLVATMMEMRGIIGDLQPMLLERLGLLPALHQMAAGFGARTGVACRLVAPTGLAAGGGVSIRAANCIYRVVQEALNNVDKHALARSANIQLVVRAGSVQVVVIEDDGCGIDPLTPARLDAFGLRGARLRSREIGAQLRVTTPAAGGTRVELRLPSQRHGAAAGSDADGQTLVHS